MDMRMVSGNPSSEKFSTEALSRLFQEIIEYSSSYREARLVVQRNCYGNIWLGDEFLYKSLASALYNTPRGETDFDFFVEKPSVLLDLPEGWTATQNSCGNPRLKKGFIKVDYIPLRRVHSIVRRELPATIENYLSGTPFTVQSMVYDLTEEKIIGDIGREALRTKKVAVHNAEEAAYVAEMKKTTVEELLQRKAQELRFEVVS